VPELAYRAVDRRGRRIRGQEDAVSPIVLTRSLEARGLVVLEVRESQSTPVRTGWQLGSRQRVLELTRALAALLRAGFPLARALAAAAHVTAGETHVATIAIRGRVERGESLATALSAYANLFPAVYVGLVRAGERSGDLTAAFERLADQLEREDRLRARLFSLAVYPTVLATAGSVALGVLAFFVLPRFAELLTGTGTTLPRSTALVIDVANGLRNSWPGLVGVLALSVVGVMWARRTERGRRITAGALLAIPWVGRLRAQALGARFARLVGVLLGGGAPLLVALEEARGCMPDPLVRNEIDRIWTRVREGVALHRATAESGFFPVLLSQLLAVGDDAGRVAEFLMKAAAILEERTERAAQRLVTLIEPALIVSFGLVVAFVALSVLQAIYGINTGVYR
jgi:general secretion pathway protein F